MSAISETTSTPFSVSIVEIKDRETHDEILTTVKAWQDFVTKQHQMGFEDDFATSHTAISKLCAKLPTYFLNSNTRCMVVRNSATNAIEAIALLFFSHGVPETIDLQPPPNLGKINCNIHWIATNPKNIKSEVNKDPVRGAGTKAIQTLQNYLSNSKATISATALTSNLLPFFTNLGFEIVESNQMEWSTVPKTIGTPFSVSIVEQEDTATKDEVKSTIKAWKEFIIQQGKEGFAKDFEDSFKAVGMLEAQLPIYQYANIARCMVVRNSTTNAIEAIALLFFSQEIPEKVDLQNPPFFKGINCTISWAATNPKNIKSEVNKDRVKGAGAEAIRVLQSYLSKSSATMFLTAINAELVTYYSRFDFTILDQKEMQWVNTP